MDVWFLLGVCVIPIMILTTQGTVTIQTVPGTLIQGKSASITCNDPDIATIEKYNTSNRNFGAITSCLIIRSSCELTPATASAQQNTGIYTISKTSTRVSVNIANVSRDRDGGMWRCEGTNKVTDTIDIDVKVPVPDVTIISNNNSIFTDGMDTYVSCKSGVSYPHATIKWSINGGNNVGSGTTSNNSDGTTTSILQYTADKSDHNKILQCTATNGYGPNKTDSITLNIRYSPILHIEPGGDYFVIQAKQLMLTCKVDDANPSVQEHGYTWSYDGVQVPAQTSSTYILTSHRSHTGSYTCTGSNSIGPGTTSTPVQVGVLYPPIVSTPSTYQVIESTNLTLQCTATANPGNINYRWTGPGGLNSTGSSLTISNIGKDKPGVYTCIATNIMIPTIGQQETGRGTNTTTVSVLYGPAVTISPDDMTKILENTDHRLNCTVQSNPTPTTFRWYLPNGTSKPGDRELVISKRDQGGIYRCEANTTLVPTVGSPITRSDSTTIDITVLYLDPVMLTPVEDKQEGDTISITCSTNSSPVALVTWYNGTTIISSKQTNTNTFTIPQATCLDTGDYTCQATNVEIPSVQCNQSLTLLVKCSPRQDTRVRTTSRFIGNITDIVQLVADVISYPPPTFTWYYNNITTGDVEPIYNDDVFKQNNTNISINTYRSTLNINITSNIYYTTYTVNVSNNIGYTQLEYQVVARSKPGLPSRINYSPPTHDSICIKWTPGFNGGDQQEYIVQHSVDNKTWTSSTPLPESFYCIKNLQANTTYYIRVIATNQYGESQPAYSSTIQTLPRIDAPTGQKSSNWGLIGGIIGGVVVAILVVVVVIVLVKRRRKQNADTENRHIVPLVEVPSTPPGGMIIDEVVNYISADEITKDETATYAQVKKGNKTTELKPNPEAHYATVNKTKNDEATKPTKPDVISTKPKKPDVKPKKPDVKPKKTDTKSKLPNVKSKQATNDKSTKSKGEVYENVGIFGDINGINRNEYENHSIKPGPPETVYADLDFDGYQPTTTVRGQDDAVEYSGIDYTKRGPTQPTPPDSSDDDGADNRE